MRPIAFAAALGLLVPAAFPVLAQQPEPGLRPLLTADDMRDWEAVGRLDSGVSFCTATLIAPDLALTAAHCLFTQDGTRLADADLTFSAGLRNGRAEAVRSVAQSLLPPGYARPLGQADLDSIGQDIALLRLDRAVPASTVRPMAVGAQAGIFSAVTLVSYGTDRAAFPSIEEDCRILSAVDAVQMLSCHVVSGSSGAPVVQVGPDGPELVAIVSGRSDMPEGDITVAVATDGLLPSLMAAQAASPAPGPRSSQGGSIIIRRVGGDAEDRSGLGARFLRP